MERRGAGAAGGDVRIVAANGGADLETAATAPVPPSPSTTCCPTCRRLRSPSSTGASTIIFASIRSAWPAQWSPIKTPAAVVQGGSTLTQQLAKNSLPQAGTDLRAEDPGADPVGLAGSQMARRRSSSFIPTASISAPVPTASTPAPRTPTSASRRATSHPGRGGGDRRPPQNPEAAEAGPRPGRARRPCATPAISTTPRRASQCRRRSSPSGVWPAAAVARTSPTG